MPKNDFEVHSCEIEMQILWVPIPLATERDFLKVQDGCDYKCLLHHSFGARHFPKRTLENVLKNAFEISQQELRNRFDWRKHWRLRKFGNKKHEHFSGIGKLWMKWKGIERRISSIEPNLLKNETIDFVSNLEPLCHIPYSIAKRK